MALAQGVAVRVPFALSVDGDPQTGLDGQTFAGAEIRVVRLDTGAIANASGAAGVIGVGGGTGLYSLELSAGELSLGLAPGERGMVVIVVDKVGAILRNIIAFEVEASAAGAGAAPTVGEIAAELAADFAAIPAAVGAELAADFAAIPSASANATAVGALVDADGVTLLQRSAETGAMLTGDGTFSADGAFSARSRDGLTVRVAGNYNATTGARTVTTRDGD